MNPTPITATALAIATALFVPVVAAAAQINENITVSITPATTEVVLGESFDITVDVTSTGPEPTPPLALHIDITDPASESSVDPEDWTSILTRTLGIIESDRTSTLTWTLQPISPGTYSIYAVALSPGIDNGTVSNIVTVDVADQRSLNPGGILPIAIATPTAIGGLLVLQLRRGHPGRNRNS